MQQLSDRLAWVKLDIGDQAEYLQHLLDQFDLPYDAWCSLQITVADLQSLAARIQLLAAELPREPSLPQRRGPRRRRSAK